MTSPICPTCGKPLVLTQARPAEARNGIRWWRARCGHVDSLHARKTVLLGAGQTPEEAVASYLERVERNNAIAARRAENVAAKLAGILTEAQVRERERNAAVRRESVTRPEAAVDETCPVCKVPLRVYVDAKRDGTGACTGEVTWYACCPKYGSRRTGCGFRNSRIQGSTAAEAVTRWLDDSNRYGTDKPVENRGRAKPRAGSQGRFAHVGSVDNFPRCHCGARIFDSSADCGGHELTIHDYARSGREAGGFVSLR